MNLIRTFQEHDSTFSDITFIGIINRGLLGIIPLCILNFILNIVSFAFVINTSSHIVDG